MPETRLGSKEEPRGVLAVITARGGSKGLPGKNVHPFLGLPLIAHTIAAARDCPLVGRCLVTTDDGEIASVSRRFGAEVVDRPAALATDTARSADAVRHVLDLLAGEAPLPETLVLLQPTSPLRTAAHLTRCLEAFLPSSFASAISVTEVEHHPYKDLRIEGGALAPLFDARSLEAPRQNLPAVFRPNGAIFAVRTEAFLRQNAFFVAPAMPFVMTRDTSCDIDTLVDLRLAELYARGIR